MHIRKLFIPILLALLLTFGLVGGLSQASGAVAAPDVPTATTLYVDADAAGPTHDGQSWATAFTTVQDALAIAASGTEIWVAAGVYYPDEGAGQVDDDAASTFSLMNDVALYGGFDPGSGIDEFAERDWETYVTVLSGDIDHETYPDITDPYGVVTNTENITGTNAYHVVYSSGVAANARLDGFSITAGQAAGNDTIPCDQQCGGGMFNDDSNPTLANVTFSGNSAAKDGGGMLNTISDLALTNVTFFGNRAGQDGGGIYNWISDPTLTNVAFFGNSAGGSGGGMFTGASDPVLSNVIFSGNRAELYGGGMLNLVCGSIFTNVTFSGNSAGFGGGMYNASSSPTLINLIFSGNSALLGSEIYNVNDSVPVIRYSDIQGCGGSSNWASACGSDGGGNLDADPLFLRNPDMDTGDYGDLHLQPGSPAIDSGTNMGCPTTDLESDPRPVNGTCDMGAFETSYNPALRLSVDNLRPRSGQTITFSVSLANQGLDLAGGWISDTLPVGLHFIGPFTLEPPGVGLVGSAPPILITDLAISNSQSITLTFPVSVSQELSVGTRLINTVVFTSTAMTVPVQDRVILSVRGDFDLYLPLVGR